MQNNRTCMITTRNKKYKNLILTESLFWRMGGYVRKVTSISKIQQSLIQLDTPPIYPESDTLQFQSRYNFAFN